MFTKEEIAQKYPAGTRIELTASMDKFRSKGCKDESQALGEKLLDDWFCRTSNAKVYMDTCILVDEEKNRHILVSAFIIACIAFWS